MADPSNLPEEELYIQILDSLHEGESWREDYADVCNAGVAVAAVVLQHGRCDLRFLRRTGFTDDALTEARRRLRTKGPITGPANDCKHEASEEDLESGIYWTLLSAVAGGMIEMVTTDA